MGAKLKPWAMQVSMCSAHLASWTKRMSTTACCQLRRAGDNDVETLHEYKSSFHYVSFLSSISPFACPIHNEVEGGWNHYWWPQVAWACELLIVYPFLMQLTDRTWRIILEKTMSNYPHFHVMCFQYSFHWNVLIVMNEWEILHGCSLYMKLIVVIHISNKGSETVTVSQQWYLTHMKTLSLWLTDRRVNAAWPRWLRLRRVQVGSGGCERSGWTRIERDKREKTVAKCMALLRCRDDRHAVNKLLDGTGREQS